MKKTTVLLLISFLSITISGFSNPLTSILGKSVTKALVKKEANQITKQVTKKGIQAASKAATKESIKIAAKEGAKEVAKKGTKEIFVEKLPQIIISTGVGFGTYEVAHNTTKPFVAISNKIEDGSLDGEAITSQFLEKSFNAIIRIFQQPLLIFALIVGFILFVRLVDLKQLADSIKSMSSQNKSNNTCDNTASNKDNKVIDAEVISKEEFH